MRHMLVKLFIFIIADFRFGTGPQCRRFVNRFLFIACFALVIEFGHHDGQGDMIRIFVYYAAQPIVVEKIIFSFTQMQGDAGTAFGLFNIFDIVFTFTAGLPAYAMFAAKPGAACFQRHLVGHNECRIEADAELTDQMRIFGLITGEVIEKFAGTRIGDSADIIHHFLTVHTNAVIHQSNGASGLIETDIDFQLAVVLIQGLIGQRFETELVTGIRGVGNQLTQKYLFIGIQGMNHEVQ